jgi:ABC-2 type transport system ATP-binding protein
VAALRGAVKRYGRVTALDGLDLAIHAGELLALLGPNGAGKTTAVNLLLGLARPTAGSAQLFGLDPRSRAARTRTGAMLQIAKVPETLKVREHLELVSSYYPRPRPLPETLAAAGLTEVSERLYGRLSGGQRQRLMFGLALCGRPDLLFLDEPTVGLDVEARRGLWRQIEALVRGGCAVLLTTHHLEEAEALAHRIVLLSRGRTIAEGTPNEIKARVSGRTIRCRTRLAAAEIERLPGVRGVTRRGEEVELFAAEAEPVVRELLARDAGLSGLEVRGAALEEAFLALTGVEEAAARPEVAA